jgi:exopolysaccharide biosynthesis WecB/TagA/CpsF family protein
MVGSAIDFWSGAKKRAPVWMQKIGLEWLYRLFQEPKRLWKRYIIGIPVFMFNIILIKVKLLLKKEST